MRFLDLLLIFMSSAGLLHGITFAIYLAFFKKKKTVTNYLLAAILIVMAFRIGKSVMLNFGSHLEPLFIFSGLALLVCVGPLLRWYVKGMTETNFKISRYSLLELIPFVFIFTASFFAPTDIFETTNQQLLYSLGLFSCLYTYISRCISSYLHFILKRYFRSTKQLTRQNLINPYINGCAYF